METQLRQRLLATATLAAQQFDVSLIEAVQDEGDTETPAYESLVERLDAIRVTVPDVRFAYLVRRTDDANWVTFIADADDAFSFEELDEDADGTLDDDEAPGMPGERYDITEFPAFQTAFTEPSVDDEVTVDQWGSFISGYAPIKDDAGNTVAVLGLDMSAGEFHDIARSIFSPVAFLLMALGALALAAYTYVIVQRRRFEALKQLERDRTALLDLATHQLGAPLATLRWWLEILRERTKGKSGEDVEACDQLQVGVDRMDHIVRSLQEASHLQTGKLAYHPEDTDLGSFVTGVVASMRDVFDLKNQQVSVVIAPNLPHVQIDRAQIGGVLGELLENARGYSPQDSVIVVRLSREKASMKLEVEDTGCGISKEDLPTVFQKFTRGKNAFIHKPVGNGLGLYICKGIVERAGGRIALQSQEGKGTTVTITFPINT